MVIRLFANEGDVESRIARIIVFKSEKHLIANDSGLVFDSFT